MIPSLDALWCHWKRSCWVIDMWGQADQNVMELQDILACGWKVANESLSIDWDSDHNIQIQHFLPKVSAELGGNTSLWLQKEWSKMFRRVPLFELTTNVRWNGRGKGKLQQWRQRRQRGGENNWGHSYCVHVCFLYATHTNSLIASPLHSHCAQVYRKKVFFMYSQ